MRQEQGCTTSQRLSELERAFEKYLTDSASCAPTGGFAAPRHFALLLILGKDGELTTRLPPTDPVANGVVGCLLARAPRPQFAPAEAVEWLGVELEIAPGKPVVRWTPPVPGDAAPAGAAPVTDPAATVDAAMGGAQPVSGRLPPEVIRDVVRAHYELFRPCYEQALIADPKLTGRVTARFVIARDGHVSDVTMLTDMPECTVAECSRRVFSALRFPRPEGGIVTVQYPIMFEPG